MKTLKLALLLAFPLLPSSRTVAQPIQCSLLSAGNNSVFLSWTATPGKHYHIQIATNLDGAWLNAFNPPETFTACTNSPGCSLPVAAGVRFFRIAELSTNSVPMGMALIPAGSFTMGDTFNEGDSEELPPHTVYVSSFYMDRCEVSKALWDSVFQWATNHGYTFGTPGAGKADDHPAQSTPWYGMAKWCNARSEKEGRVPAYYTDAAHTIVFRTGASDVQNDWVNWSGGYRLPTEAEWEKGARGGFSGYRFPWGDTISHSQANYYSTADYTYDVSPTRGHHPAFDTGEMPYTAPTGSFPPNGFGLYDVVGNVWELCWAW